MLSYEALRKTAIEEKNSNKLSKLPETFFQEVREYLEAKSKAAENKEDIWELTSARRTVQDIMETRERKILTAAFYHPKTGTVPENMTPEEKEFFEKVVKCIEELKEKRKKALENKERMSLVALLQDIPRFVGIDMKTYGPFRQGEVASIPEENAKVLAEKNAAKIIDMR